MSVFLVYASIRSNVVQYAIRYPSCAIRSAIAPYGTGESTMRDHDKYDGSSSMCRPKVRTPVLIRAKPENKFVKNTMRDHGGVTDARGTDPHARKKTGGTTHKLMILLNNDEQKRRDATPLRWAF